MTKIPLTRIPASPEKAATIRAAVRSFHIPHGAPRKLATPEDAERLFALISEPAVLGPIYSLPKPTTLASTKAFIERHVQEHARGEGLLILDKDEDGAITSYYDVQFWPEWSACELAGAIRPDRQNSGAGGKGAAATFSWLFDEIGVDLICETAALDNTRTARLLGRLGFKEIGLIDIELPGGGSRPSRYWEMRREDWNARK